MKFLILIQEVKVGVLMLKYRRGIFFAKESFFCKDFFKDEFKIFFLFCTGRKELKMIF